MVMALTPTPSTLTRSGAKSPRCEATRRRGQTDTPAPALMNELPGLSRGSKRPGHLLLDPGVCPGESLLEGDLRFPAKHLPQPGIVRVPAAHALWTRNMFLDDRDAGHARHQVRQSVDRDQPVLAKV